MVTPIHFDDESCWETSEICNVVSYGVLASEPVTLNVVA